MKDFRRIAKRGEIITKFTERRLPRKKLRLPIARRVAKKRAGPGRPAGVYKHLSPLTGKKVPATTYYKHLKRTRRRMKTISKQARLREQAIMARRGVPPQITRMRQERRITPPVEVPPEEIPAVPITPIPTQFPIQQRYRIATDIMTGRKIIKSILPRERWTM